MRVRRHISTMLVGAVAALLALVAVPTASAVQGAASGAPDLPAGTVVRSATLTRALWIPGTTRAAYKLTYITSNTFGHQAYSTGTVFIPRGTAPAGGWPVISWAHGTSGMADKCAPSNVGPAEPARDWAYLSTWMRQGYAIVASDYAGLGTPGEHAYLDGKAAAHTTSSTWSLRAATSQRRSSRPRCACPTSG